MRRRSLSLRWSRAMVALYPRAWRERYGQEVAELLGRHPVTLWTVVDMLSGALDAHLHRDLLPERLVSLTQRMRTSEITIFCAFVLFGVGWLPAQQLRDPLSAWEPTVQRHPEIRVLYDVVQVAGLLALLILLLGGLPLIVSAIRRAVATRRRDVLGLLGVPVLAAALLVLYAALASSAWTQKQSAAADAPLTPLAVVLQLGLLVAFVIAVCASTAALALAVGRAPLSERAVRLASWPAAAVTLAIGVGLAGTLALDALIVREAPQLWTPFSQIPTTLLMVIAALLAGLALKRGLDARNAAEG